MSTNPTIDQLNQNKLQYINEQKMCLEAFLLQINDEVSVSCSMPIKLPTQNVLNVIERCKKYFYKNYEYAVEESYLFVDRAIFNTDLFKAERVIILPDAVNSVYGIHKIDYAHFDIGKDFMRYSNNYINYGVESTFEDLMGFVAAEMYRDIRETVLVKKWSSFNYNYLTKKLRLSGEISDTDLVLEVYKIIDDCNLFQDDLFFKYVLGHVLKNIGNMMGLFTYNLPGNVTLNSDNLKSDGVEMIEKVEEEIKTTTISDFFMTS